MKTVLITGGFDPIHSGHIAYINSARELGDKLVVGLNSDEWLVRKKGNYFMPWEERKTVLTALKNVDVVIAFDDTDGTACDAIRIVKELDGDVVFANGGDRTSDNIPEMIFDDVDFVFGVGGEDKKNSSSSILSQWKTRRTERPWGYYRVLHEEPGMKVKELAVDPGKSLSNQKHFKRNEYWMVSEGEASVDFQKNPKWRGQITRKFTKHEEIQIPCETWHRLYNETEDPVRIIEIQYGEECSEEDIERI